MMINKTQNQYKKSVFIGSQKKCGANEVSPTGFTPNCRSKRSNYFHLSEQRRNIIGLSYTNWNSEIS